MKRKARGPGSSSGQLRIIGGQWRGRKLQFPAVDGLRPTTDRIRETLFNWLAPDIHQARVADLFSGSGALGLEALSRGAAHCDFVDANDRVISALAENARTLQAEPRLTLHAQPTDRFLQQQTHPWDIVFVDPPFSQGMAVATCQQLEARQLLADNSLVYVETARDESTDGMPERWQLHRDKSAGGVAYRLYRVP